MGKTKKRKLRSTAPSTVEDLVKLSRKRAQQYAFQLDKSRVLEEQKRSRDDRDGESSDTSASSSPSSDDERESNDDKMSVNSSHDAVVHPKPLSLQSLLLKVRERKVATLGDDASEQQQVDASIDQTEPQAGAVSDGQDDSDIKVHSLFKAFTQLQPKKKALVSVLREKDPKPKETTPREQGVVKQSIKEGTDKDEQHESQQVARSDFTAVNKTNATNVTLLETDATAWKLNPGITDCLASQGIKHLFPIQRQAIPAILATDISTGGAGNDVCINAPTGSGKTFVYAIPVVQLLCKRKIVRLRALAIVPSRELASQVYKVFHGLCASTGLKVDIATGQTSLLDDNARLLSSSKVDTTTASPCESLVDILVVTPGRLMDHLKLTPGFSLQDLEYLIVDEADRLLSQSYHDWLDKVYAAVFVGDHEQRDEQSQSSAQTEIQPCASQLQFQKPRLLMKSPRMQSSISVNRIGAMYPPLRKILCSATLTRNPQKLAALALRNPIQFSTAAQPTTQSHSKAMATIVDAGSAKYTLPDGLQERMILCSHSNKPLLLVRLILNLTQDKRERTIVFTSSLKATSRVANLLQRFPQLAGRVSELSSHQSQSQRSKVLGQFKSGKCAVIVASDVVARGIDIKGLSNVVSYDPPVYVKSYVHRVGRTARAGGTGNSYTLVRRDQARHFRQLFKKTGNVLETLTLDKESIASIKDQFDNCLEDMKTSIGEDA